MKTTSRVGLPMIAIAVLGLLLGACNEDQEMGKGDVDFEITDAPSDDESIKSVFVTIAEVRVDGKAVEGFTKQTIDLKAYHEGDTKLLVGAKHLDARSYNNLVLVLDLNSDASGNSPGCYVQTVDNAKYRLSSSANATSEIAINKSWDVVSNTKSTVVLDFDLRKSIKYMSDPIVRYNFVSNGGLSSAIRVVNKGETGSISGSYQENSNTNADKIIVYAYKKGTFNQSTETTAQGEGQVYFANAAASAEVRQGIPGKTFMLALLESGEYELYFAAHKKDASGRLTFQSMLTSETSINGAVGNTIKVDPAVTITVSALISVW